MKQWMQAVNLFPVLAGDGIPDSIFTMTNRRETLHGARCRAALPTLRARRARDLSKRY